MTLKALVSPEYCSFGVVNSMYKIKNNLVPRERKHDLHQRGFSSVLLHLPSLIREICTAPTVC